MILQKISKLKLVELVEDESRLSVSIGNLLIRATVNVKESLIELDSKKINEDNDSFKNNFEYVISSYKIAEYLKDNKDSFDQLKMEEDISKYSFRASIKGSDSRKDSYDEIVTLKKLLDATDNVSKRAIIKGWSVEHLVMEDSAYSVLIVTPKDLKCMAIVQLDNSTKELSMSLLLTKPRIDLLDWVKDIYMNTIDRCHELCACGTLFYTKVSVLDIFGDKYDEYRRTIVGLEEIEINKGLIPIIQRFFDAKGEE